MWKEIFLNKIFNFWKRLLKFYKIGFQFLRIENVYLILLKKSKAQTFIKNQFKKINFTRKFLIKHNFGSLKHF